MTCCKSFYHTMDVEYVDPEYGYVVCETIFKVLPAENNPQSDWDTHNHAEIEEAMVFLEGVPVNYIQVPDKVLYSALNADIRKNIITNCFYGEDL